MVLDLSKLDAEQRAAATAQGKHALVFAGAGSGKTRTLTARVAWLLDQGVPASRIMAVTFTRKAADEMRRRLDKLVPEATTGLRIGTFHAQMAMGLRRYAGDALGLVGRSARFTVYDEDDRERLVGRLLREAGLNGMEGGSSSAVARAISRAKNAMADPSRLDAAEQADPELSDRLARRIWESYDQALRSADAFDFDDLLVAPVRLLEHDQVRARWAGSIGHLLVDEFQDTNAVQIKLVELLASEGAHIFAVGDDAQSIYRFRGAQVENILRFDERFPGTQRFELRQNYRSTQAILNLANDSIGRSKENRPKRLKAAVGGEGSKPILRVVDDAQLEARLIAGSIAHAHKAGAPLAEMAILVRTNGQTRLIETELARSGLPYRVLGGTAFWGRREVRDLISWLRLIANPRDGAAAERALGAPVRGIGDRLISAVRAAASSVDGDWVEGIAIAGNGPEGTVKGRTALRDFSKAIRHWATQASTLSPAELTDLVLRGSNLETFHDDGTEEGEGRIENLREVVNAAATYQIGELDTFIEATALDAAHGESDASDRLSIATLHAAKGLEWRIVVLAGCEEGFLPHVNSREDADLEEERRLFYVGVTRAARRLMLTIARRRMVAGGWEDRTASRFVIEALRLLDVREDPLAVHEPQWRPPGARPGGIERRRPARRSR
jgi:DNA helicase-2/ATP-dependent DNA helicase PcrA